MITERLLSFTLALGVGWVLYLLIGLSVLSVAVMLERGVFFGRRRVPQFNEMVRLCLKGDLKGASALATGDAMESVIVREASGAAAGGTDAVQKAVASIIDRKRLEYDQWLFILGTLGNNAPFIGLFGTVLGIIRAFADLAIANKAAAGSDPSAVMSGISEALVATAVGLFVAIPAVLAFNVFQRLLKRVIGRSQSIGNAIASGLHANEAP